MRKLSLFSGIGGIDLAAHWAGIETVAFCEREPFPVQVLKRRFNGVPIYDDVFTLTAQRLEEDGVLGPDRAIDLISGGFPCQPFSAAGKRGGTADDRYLWPEMFRIVTEVRPTWVLAENVDGLISMDQSDRAFVLEDATTICEESEMVLETIRRDFAEAGYDSIPIVIPSAAVGAPHPRNRIFIVAYTGIGQRFTGPKVEGILRAMFEDGTEYGDADRSSQTQSRYFLGDTEHVRQFAATVGGSSDTSGHNDKEGQNETVESSRASRSSNDGFMADSSSEGLSQWGRSNITQGNAEDGTGMESELERCCENVADFTSLGQSRQREHVKSGNQASRRNGEASQPFDVRIGTEWPTEPTVGRVLDGISARLDGFRWPAGLGQPQHDWEPPRVAAGVKNRVPRLKALGNAVNPYQVYPILYFIKQIHDALCRA